MALRPAASASWVTLTLAIFAAGAIVLAGCAVAVPLRPLTTASQESRGHVACTATSKCANAITTHRRPSPGSQPVGGGSIADAPPDFILNDPNAMLH
jgi:hypothetical protein